MHTNNRKNRRGAPSSRAKFTLLATGAAVVIALWLAFPTLPTAQAQEATANCGGASNPLHGRTEKVVETIVSDLSAGNCDSVTNAQLAGITRLILSYKSITSLQDGDFAGLTGMGTLDLNNNSLTTLPEDVFDGLSSLQTLNLQSNSLGSLPEDVFDGLSSLRVLNLWANSLTTLPEDLFDGLSDLRTVNLYNNSLATLPADVFDGLSNLQTLNLYNNSLTTLPEDLFDGLAKVVTLRLYSNSLTTLPEAVFDGLSAMEVLRLDQNSLEQLAPDLFDGLSSLEDLHLEQNTSLACIHAGQFDGLSSLRILKLEGTKLGNIAPTHGSGWGLNSLQELRFGTTVIGSSQLSFADYKSVFPALVDTRTYVNLAALSDPICGPIEAEADANFDGTVSVQLEESRVRPNRARETGSNGDGFCGSSTSEDRHKLWSWQRSQDGLTWANVDPGRQPKDYGTRGGGECSFLYTPHTDDNGMYVRAFVPVDTVGVGENNYYSAVFGPLNVRQ